jgi:hypothetical protein
MGSVVLPIPFTVFRVLGPGNLYDMIQCSCSGNCMVRYSVVSYPATAGGAEMAEGAETAAGAAEAAKTGPNDARYVVWALGTSFFVFFVSFETN